MNRLGRFARLIRFDKRGTGLSDRNVGLPDFEMRMDDVRAVLDAVGSEHAALSGLRFEDRGEHELKGIAGARRLYAVLSPPPSSEGPTAERSVIAEPEPPRGGL